MGGFVLAAVVPVIAELGDDLHAKVPLLLLIEGLVQEGILHLGLGGDGLDQLHLLRAQGIEDLLHIAGFHTRLEIIQQGIVGMLKAGEEGGITLAQLDHLLEVRLEDGRSPISGAPSTQACWATAVTWLNSTTYSVGTQVALWKSLALTLTRRASSESGSRLSA